MQHPQRDATGQGNKHVAPRNIVSGGEAAKRLGINRSTLTRYLKTYPELNRSRIDGKIAVDLDELAQHRGENVNMMKSGNHAGRVFDEPAPAPLLRPEPRPREIETEDEPDDGGLQDETVAKIRARAERIKLNRLEREEAAETGQLTPAAEVEEAIGNALVKLRDALMSPDLDLCEKIASTADPAEVTSILREAHRKVLTKLSEDFENDAQRGGAA